MTDITAARELAITTRDTDVFIVPTSPEGRRRVPHVADIEAGLSEAGTRKAVAEALLRAASADIAAWADAATMLGLDVARVARLAGVARGTIYNRRK